MAAQSPVASHHLTDERWPGRGNPSEDPLEAWHRSHPLELPTSAGAYPPLPGHDEARVDPHTMTVLFRRGETLTTCYDLDLVDSWHGHAARAAVRSQYPELIHDE